MDDPQGKPDQQPAGDPNDIVQPADEPIEAVQPADEPVEAVQPADEPSEAAQTSEKPEEMQEAIAEAEMVVAPARGGLSVSSEAVRSVLGFLCSMVIHLLLVILLALWLMPGVVETSVAELTVRAPVEPVEELETVFLDQQDTPATEMTMAVSSASSMAGVEKSQAEKISEVNLDDSLLDDPVGMTVDIDGMLASVAGRNDLINEVPEGTPGQGRAVADGYQDAIDRITREIMLMLYKEKVLVVWCFDQSQSMKDDQRQIRDRVERVYSELGLSDQASGDALTTAVTSYGKEFGVHTKAPTNDYSQIRAAIDQVPIDPSGEESMCPSIARAISMHRDYAVKGRRRMALILVTDESGDRVSNVRHLESMIATAKSARCKIYVLGREAVFGYGYAYFRYRHPQTNRPHWLRVDRGPETAFVEQLQIDGFRRRYDSHPSGFGPYEQARMAQATGGIFFLLPTDEKDLVHSGLARGENRRYELDAMRWYHPDLRSRKEIFLDRDRHPLRKLLWKIANDLNPYVEISGRTVEVQVRFSPDFSKFVKQVQENQGKAKVLIAYLARASKELEEKKFLREREPEVRWKANYDLMRAQVIAYQARLYEYGAYLDAFVKKPTEYPFRKGGEHLEWLRIRTRKETLTGDTIKEHVARANELFAEVVKAHPGTPWASRAQYEKNRGYGVELRPDYEPPYKDVTNPSALPKL